MTTTPKHVAVAIRDALDLIAEIHIPAQGEAVGFAVDLDQNDQSNLIIATSDGCHFKVTVTRDE